MQCKVRLMYVCTSVWMSGWLSMHACMCACVCVIDYAFICLFMPSSLVGWGTTIQRSSTPTLTNTKSLSHNQHASWTCLSDGQAPPATWKVTGLMPSCIGIMTWEWMICEAGVCLKLVPGMTCLKHLKQAMTYLMLWGNPLPILLRLCPLGSNGWSDLDLASPGPSICSQAAGGAKWPCHTRP